MGTTLGPVILVVLVIVMMPGYVAERAGYGGLLEAVKAIVVNIAKRCGVRITGITQVLNNLWIDELVLVGAA